VPYAGCLRIDNNFKLTELAPRPTAAYNVPVAFVGERFICAHGGQISSNKATTECEAFDIVKCKWFKIQPLPQPRYSTSAVVMNNMAIYVMPGPGGAQGGNAANIFKLDLVAASKHSKEDVNYLKNMANQKWETITVPDGSFNQAAPSVCIAENAV